MPGRQTSVNFCHPVPQKEAANFRQLISSTVLHLEASRSTHQPSTKFRPAFLKADLVISSKSQTPSFSLSSPRSFSSTRISWARRLSSSSLTRGPPNTLGGG